MLNECEKLEKERKNLMVELNKLDDKIKNKTLLESIEYFYYNKNYLMLKVKIRMTTKEINKNIY